MELKRIMFIEGGMGLTNSSMGTTNRNINESLAKMTLDEERRMVWVEPTGGGIDPYFVPLEALCIVVPKNKPAQRQPQQNQQGQRR